MRFCKENNLYYMPEKRPKLPGFTWKNLGNRLKKSSRKDSQSRNHPDVVRETKACIANNNCPVCDGAFFPSLLNDMSAVVSYFNLRAKKLVKLHQAASFRKYFVRFKGIQRGTNVSLTEEVQDLVIYALTNAIHIKKILTKFDEVHNCCNQGPAVKSRARCMQNEILQSPWLGELMAMHINLRETNENSGIAGPAILSKGYNLTLNEDKPSLSCEFDSIQLDVGLTCPVCLETVFDAVSLSCGHILCKICACSAASVSIVEGLKSAEPKEKCPLCRKAGVYAGAVHLTEISILLSRRCREYWEKRLRIERVERVEQAKEYWESQCRAFIGI